MSHGQCRSLVLYQQRFLREGVEVLGLALEYRQSLWARIVTTKC
jgi:hypothetical protein